MDEVHSNLTVFRSDKHEYLVRVVLLADGESAGRPAYLVFRQNADPILVPNADERKIAAHRWDRASINQLFYFKPWKKSSLTGL